MNPVIFISNQLYNMYESESLLKVGVCTVFLKRQDTEYSFGGKILYENDNIIIFIGLPKRIEIDDMNLVDSIDYIHTSELSMCYDLKQSKQCKFDEFLFEFDKKKYYSIDDLKLLLTA